MESQSVQRDTTRFGSAPCGMRVNRGTDTYYAPMITASVRLPMAGDLIEFRKTLTPVAEDSGKLGNPEQDPVGRGSAAVGFWVESHFLWEIILNELQIRVKAQRLLVDETAFGI